MAKQTMGTGFERISGTVKFIPDFFDYYLSHEHILQQKIGKPKLLKCHAIAQTLIEHNVMSRKLLYTVLAEHAQNSMEQLITLLKARALLTDLPPTEQSEAYQQNSDIKDQILLSLAYATDQLLFKEGEALLQAMGFSELSKYFAKTAQGSAKPLTLFYAEVMGHKGDIQAIMLSTQKLATEHAPLLKSLGIPTEDQFELAKGLMSLLSQRHKDHGQPQGEQTATVSNFELLNAFSNIVSLVSLVREYFADMKASIAISLTVAEQAVAKEVAAMSNADAYKSASLQVLVKSLRCSDSRSKIAVINRITAIVNSLGDSFFVSENGKEVAIEKVREFTNVLVKSEDKFNAFVQNRL